MILRQIMINHKKRCMLKGTGFGRSEQYKLSFFSLLVFSSASLPPASPYTADGTCTLQGENNSGVLWKQQCEPALVSLQSLPVWRGPSLPGLTKGGERGYPVPPWSRDQRREEVEKALAGAASIPGMSLLPTVEHRAGAGVHKVPEAASPLSSG